MNFPSSIPKTPARSWASCGGKIRSTSTIAGWRNRNSGSPSEATAGREQIMSYDPPAPLVESLLRPAAYPYPVKNIELLQTHISWVFLTGEFTYKVKKPVSFGFVDFSTLERRRFFCDEELRLNRRLAPELYLDVLR